MQVNIKAIHFDISTALTDFINKKVEKLVRRYPAIDTVDVTLKVVKPQTADNKEATLSIPVAGADVQVASKTADTFEEAVDLALDAVEHKLAKIKGNK
ncbi:MAG: ribosome-associated translation inhibitor RaiA [Duncaniella sp.]|nr:ribosome-associated translation inhibitor RaiA [Duncaniella sp.]